VSRPLRLIALVAAFALLVFPAAASADGDPASDVLLSQDVFFPYAPKTTSRLRDALTGLLQRTRKSGYPMKVALIESPGDLGANGALFDRPLDYANLLAQELRTLRHGNAGGEELHLLVVMPAGSAARASATASMRPSARFRSRPPRNRTGSPERRSRRWRAWRPSTATALRSRPRASWFSRRATSPPSGRGPGRSRSCCRSPWSRSRSSSLASSRPAAGAAPRGRPDRLDC